MAYILAGTLLTRALNQNTGAQIFRTNTLQENTLAISVTEEEVRGGMSNQKLGSYFHDSIMNATITDALFDLNYLATNLGGNVTVGGDAFAQETVTTTAENSITVVGTPVDFMGLGIIGRYTIQGENNWQPLTFVGQTATATGLPTGSTVCVEYTAQDSTIRQFTVSSAIVPDEVILVIEAPLFKANTKAFTQSSQVGKLIVTVPRFLFSGTQDLNMTASGASTTNLSGSALAYMSGTSCSDMGQYATISVQLFDQTPEDGLITLALDGADMQLSTTDTVPLKVIGVYNDGSRTTETFDNSRLTFTVTPSNVASVANGVLTADASGDAVLKVVATNAPTIECYGNITVS